MSGDARGARRLVFSPLAWLKLQFLCHAGPTEVAGFGLTAADDPLHVEDVLVVRQRATPVTVAFDDAAVADLFDAMTAQVDRAATPSSSPAPSPGTRAPNWSQFASRPPGSPGVAGPSWKESGADSSASSPASGI